MTDSPSSDPHDRLTHAIVRIEAALAAPRPTDPALAALEQRHARLRERVRGVIERLDAMIGAD